MKYELVDVRRVSQCKRSAWFHCFGWRREKGSSWFVMWCRAEDEVEADLLVKWSASFIILNRPGWEETVLFLQHVLL